MVIDGKPGDPPLEIPIPQGMTVSVKKAAEILGVSSSTLKRKSAEWGLTTFWDGRGRRFSLRELKEAQEGTLEPRKPATITQDLEALHAYYVPGGYRFRVYRTDEDKGYLGFYAFEDLGHVFTTLQYDLGYGTYYLKLLDEHNNMTEYNFTISVSDPTDEERAGMLTELRKRRDTKAGIRFLRQMMENGTTGSEGG